MEKKKMGRPRTGYKKDKNSKRAELASLRASGPILGEFTDGLYYKEHDLAQYVTSPATSPEAYPGGIYRGK